MTFARNCLFSGGATGTGGGVAGSVPSSGCGKATTLTSARASIDVSGKTREYILAALIGLDDTLLNVHRKAVTTYTKRDGCTTTTQTMSPSWCDGLNSKNVPCTCVSYQGSQGGYPVISCEYTAGHQQAPNPDPIWDFLAQF